MRCTFCGRTNIPRTEAFMNFSMGLGILSVSIAMAVWIIVLSVEKVLR